LQSNKVVPFCPESGPEAKTGRHYANVLFCEMNVKGRGWSFFGGLGMKALAL
jgi:hypothetical protein